MEISLGQQYNVGEKPTVILYTSINRHAGTPEKTVKTKQRQCSTPSHMVVIINYYMGYINTKPLHGIIVHHEPMNVVDGSIGCRLIKNTE